MALEQAVLSELVPAAARTHVFAWWVGWGGASGWVGQWMGGEAGEAVKGAVQQMAPRGAVQEVVREGMGGREGMLSGKQI